MSVRAFDWAWRQDVGGIEKLVLLAVADHTNDETGRSWPSLTHLSDKCGITRRSVVRVLGRLERMGIISRIQRDGMQTTIYELPITKRSISRAKQGHSVPSDTESLGTQTTQGRDCESLEVGTQCPTEPSLLNRKEPSGEDAREKSKQEPKKTKTKPTEIREDFQPNETAHRVAKESGVSIGQELPQFIDYWIANGGTKKDWQAAFRTWIRNAKKYADRDRIKPRATATPWDGAR